MEEDSDDSLASVDAVKQIGGKVPPLKVHVQIDDCDILMEVDTGASVSIMAENTYQKLWPTKELGVSGIKLQTYSRGTFASSGYERCTSNVRGSES